MSQAKVETLKAVLALAWADGEVSEDEERLVDFLVDSARLTSEEEAAVRSQNTGEVDLTALAAAVTDEKDRLWAYEVACLVSLMDGSQDPEEWAVLGAIKPVLKIDPEVAMEAEVRARQIYERFARSRAGATDESDGAS